MIRIKKWFKKKLNALGYEIRKKSEVEEVTRGKWGTTTIKNKFIVEFMGPPAVGKTSYLRALMRKSTLPLLSSDTFKAKKGLSDVDPNRVGDYHTRILELEILGLLRNEKSNFGVLERLGYAYDQILCDIRCLSQKLHVINDEGIFHHFSEPIIELANRDLKMFQQVLKDRVIIYLFGSPKTIYDQVVKRRDEEGVLWPGHKTDKESILEQTRRSLEVKRRLMDYVKRYHDLWFEVDISRGIEENTKKINLYLETEFKSRCV